MVSVLEDVDEIVVILGVDYFFVGFFDLLFLLGVVGEFYGDKFWLVIECVVVVVKCWGIFWGVLLFDLKFVDCVLELGCGLFLIVNDFIVFKKGIEVVL